MNIKIITQFFLVLILSVIIITTFFSYFNEKVNIEETNIEFKQNTKPEIDDETGTLIKDIKYTFTDLKGNSYELLSKFGKVDINNSDKIFMTDVTATIYLVDSSPIIIISKYANYNKIDHETNFFEDVEVDHLIHRATSENLDLSFTTNLATMYNNIVYNKPGTKLIADRLEIDLITKNSKIFMDSESKKIKIIDKK
ncbi:LPS export ABC transporter periplasmic protein LptC [Candidatus Pelagibacter sp.]|nr:LPS export ABC transporter periplasmic protein LptC [Candidatus Pelagibacter sp.]